MIPKPEPVELYLQTVVVFMMVGVVPMPIGIALEIWFGYVNAAENASMVCIGIWVAGMLLGMFRANRRFPSWRTELRSRGSG